MSNLQINHFPNKEEVLLLKAALLSPIEGYECWKEWLKNTGNDSLDWNDKNFLAHFFDPLPPAVWQLMPLIHTQLARFNDPIAMRFKGYKRRVWVQNQQLMHAVQSVLTTLDNLGIPHLLLDGLPMATLYYNEIALRDIATGNIWIPHAHKIKVLEILLKQPHNFVPMGHSIEYALEYKHAIILRQKHYAVENQIIIHWNLFAEHAHCPDRDTLFWENRGPFQYQSIKSTLLNPTHQFFRCVVQGRDVSAQAGLKWVVDAYTLQQKEAIDWQQMIDLSIHFNFVPFVRVALAFLKSELGVPIPDSILETFKKIPVTPEAEAYQAIIAQNSRLKGKWSFGIALLKRQYYLYHGFKKTGVQKPFLIGLICWMYARCKVLIMNRLKIIR